MNEKDIQTTNDNKEEKLMTSTAERFADIVLCLICENKKEIGPLININISHDQSNS